MARGSGRQKKDSWRVAKNTNPGDPPDVRAEPMGPIAYRPLS